MGPSLVFRQKRFVRSKTRLLISNSIPSQLRFPAIAGFSVRAGFDGGAMSSDFGALSLRDADQQMGLISRSADVIHDQRHPSYIENTMSNLLSQRIPD